MLQASNKPTGHWYILFVFSINGMYFLCIFFFKKQGYILGNPVTDTKLEHNYLIPFAYGMALISEELYEVFF